MTTSTTPITQLHACWNRATGQHIPIGVCSEKIPAKFSNDDLYLFEKFLPEYRAWSHMKSRCYNTKQKDYPYYGGRGIQVCDAWKSSFKSFLSDMGRKPTGTTLDRINNSGNYQPDNCRWATRIEQCNNQRSNRLFSFDGSTATVAEWARRTGINEGTLRSRLCQLGWPVETALNMDPKFGNRHKLQPKG